MELKKRVITKWLKEADIEFKHCGEYTKENLELVLETLNKYEASYVEMVDGDVFFYKQMLETDEEHNRRQKSEEQAKKLVEKYEFEKAKETYLKLKEKYN